MVDGFSHVDQALVTGESVPVPKKVNDCVFAGTLNSSGLLKIAVTKKSTETLVSRIVQLVVESQKRKAHIEGLVDRFARIYVPIVIALQFSLPEPYHILSEELSKPGFTAHLFCLWFLAQVPSSSPFLQLIFIAITIAAKRGVIIKGGIFIEKLAKVKSVVFDKTGTLTLGRQAVHEVRRVDISKAEDEAITYAAALDQFSNHPIAQAIVRRAMERGIDLSKVKVTDVVEVPGKGMLA